eukprot:CAMPEP_0173426914 /NCGR_PEP_ID=MMETSP1357-20121228/6253_1 /TAXON_ID=77926 /ORGANISM="Hemiselmis rufescens, Strain PCC563" /LENGTH=375 /DNA_ID=CAMNT_0014390653 /DNA_START=53 /DNA_END=1177 /DNA_ORIENTATION=-
MRLTAALALALLVLLPLSDGAKPTPLKEFITAGYIPDYRFASLDWSGLAQRLSDLILFSVEPDADASLKEVDRIPEELMSKILNIRKVMGFRLLISVGGGGRSAAFLEIVQSAALRTKFAASIASYCKKYELDGIDIDWEFDFKELPFVGVGFRQLLKQVKDKDRNLFVSVAIHVGAWDHLPSNLFKVVDRVHLMHYDHCIGPEPCRHSTLDSANATLIEAVRHIPPHKLVLGIPAYGRKMEDTGTVATYAEIIKQFGEQPKDVDEVGGYYYNGPHTVEKKVRLAGEMGLLGIFFWELGQDLALSHRDSVIRAGAGEGERLSRERKTGRREESYAQRHDREDPEKVEEAMKRMKNFGIDTDIEKGGMRDVRNTVI